jgi:hypothetical protein
VTPLFGCPSALGMAIHLAVPHLNVVVCMMGVAAALDVAITRTPWASALIVGCLSGERAVDNCCNDSSGPLAWIASD